MHRLNKIVWIIILALLVGVISMLLLSGNIALYLSPRIIPMTFFGCVVLLILFIFNISAFKTNTEHSGHVVFNLRSLIFIIPIVLFISVTPDMSTVNTIPNQNVDLSYAVGVEDEEQNNINSPTASLESKENVASNDTNEDNDPLKPQVDELIEVSEMLPCVFIDGDDDPVQGSFEEYMYLSLDEMRGREVNLFGFVYKDDSFPEDTILISRLMVSCCVADSSMVGYQVKVENADDFAEDQWIEVTGVVDEFILNMYGKDYQLPIITGGTIIMRQEPPLDEWYVYP